MGWLSVLPVVAAVLAQVPASEPSGGPVVVPIGAEPPGAVPTAPVLRAPAPPEDATRWYGAPAVAIDAAEVVLFYAVAWYDKDYQRTHGGHHQTGAETVEEILLVSTLGTGAVVHGIHHQTGRAVGSVALRAGALLTSAILASRGTCGGQEHPDCTDELIVLAAIPLAAMAVDDAVLAREPVPAAAPARDGWTPTVRVQSGLAMLGVGGSF